MAFQTRQHASDFQDALDWLDRQGGRWQTRASCRAAWVLVQLDGMTVQEQASCLSGPQVRDALVRAVAWYRNR